MRVLIKNGTVVNADGQAKQDLLIESGIVLTYSPPVRRRVFGVCYARIDQKRHCR